MNSSIHHLIVGWYLKTVNTLLTTAQSMALDDISVCMIFFLSGDAATTRNILNCIINT